MMHVGGHAPPPPPPPPPGEKTDRRSDNASGAPGGWKLATSELLSLCFFDSNLNFDSSFFFKSCQHFQLQWCSPFQDSGVIFMP